ncbi:hypothetical protein Taro_051003 [Colocasia esculenta]|uniref:Uncharacterized protein n=1 Tax=Colocasia esculenta TaxID=4460 RepID=A0A843XFM3_COLES|nr:hypothetical protein [Colocasia esculenta]
MDQGYFTNYMVIKPENGGFLDPFYLLYDGNMCGNRAVQCPEGTAPIMEMRRRWLIFVSMSCRSAVVDYSAPLISLWSFVGLFVQQILLLLRKPMACLGSMVQFQENLLFQNHGLRKLLLNVLRDSQTV